MRMTRGRALVLGFLGPWIFGLLAAFIFLAIATIAGVPWDDRVSNQLYSATTTAAVLVGFAASVYAAYWYVRDKGRHPAFTILALLSFWGWIVLLVLGDRTAKPAEKGDAPGPGTDRVATGRT